MTDDDLARAAEWLTLAKRVCVLTGAGVSAESGVPTFRASDGLWEGHRIEDVASPDGFDRDPQLVWQFYNARRANVKTVKPNPGHHALAKLEERWGDRFTLVTQNVDGLHRAAGSKNVLEIHGSLRRTRCLGCETVADRGLEPLAELPECECGARLRPDIVWFGEALPGDVWHAAMLAAYDCDVLLVVGTSAVVHPAASLVPIAKRSKTPGAKVIEVNLTQTEASGFADVGLYGPSGVVLPKLVEKLGEPGA
jgi:NAD-dependent deacetylase